MAGGGTTMRNLRMPEVARNPENGAAVISMNGAEDEFLVMQMPQSIAEELTHKLIAAGYGKGKRHDA